MPTKEQKKKQAVTPAEPKKEESPQAKKEDKK